ncbi:MAG: plasmid recombination protein [Ruminococcus sp.]|nr:plasmid recombination protein [Ruminococcus sp.]
MVGKGSVNHNSRKFKAENVDANRTHLNVSYCNKDIRKVYDDLFGEALKRYNDKQKRADRKIDDYYEKICNSKQEKPFYEIILQIGGKDNMSSFDENGELAKKILNNYFDTFEERNPYLKVFSAHLHMDEATPHLHIDFVPFTTGSKRGLDTRVSLKQALAAQGFEGGTRSDTEWNQWVSSEKSALSFFMKEHGIEWEQKGTHEKHLSVLDFKKQERTAELEKLENEIAEKKDEFEMYQDRIDNFTQGYYVIDDLAKKLDTEPDYQLQEPTKLMSAKGYKTKFVEPLIKKLREVIEAVSALYYQALDSYHRLNMTNKNLYRENQYLSKENEKLHGENTKLKEQNKDYRLLRKVFGDKQIDNLLEQARNSKAQKRDTRTR